MSAARRPRTPAVSPPDDSGSTGVPWVQWSRVVPFVNKLWDPENTPHHSIIGLTGSGKSYLAINGILEGTCQFERVLIIDSKRDDPLVSSTGKGVKEIPRFTWGANTRKKEPRDSWWRLEVEDNRAKAQRQVFKALDRVYKEGNWVVVFDELRDMTDPHAPNLGLNAYVDQLYRKGRSKHIPVIAMTQAPRWVPRSFYDQASFAWIGRLRDQQQQKRLLEIGGMDKQYLADISSLQRREWLLAADNGEHFLRTMVV